MNDINDLFDELDQEVEYAEPWVAEEGDKLVGKVTKIDQRDGGFGDYPILTIEVDQGTIDGKAIDTPATYAWHAQSTIAKEELGFDKETCRWVPGKAVQIGDTVAAKYTGYPEGKNYQMWRVIVKRRDLATELDSSPADSADLFT